MKILRPGDPCTDPDLQPVLEAARNVAGDIRIVVMGKREQGSRKGHDLEAAVSRFRVTAEALRRGYRFDDEPGKALLALLDEACTTVEQELRTWKRVYD